MYLNTPIHSLAFCFGFRFWKSNFYDAFFSSNRCVPVRPDMILWCSLLISNPIASSVLWARTFSFPRYRYLLKFISSFTLAKDPSACMLRFILNCVPKSPVIRSRHSARFSSRFLDTASFFFLSLKAVLQLFPRMQSFL